MQPLSSICTRYRFCTLLAVTLLTMSGERWTASAGAEDKPASSSAAVRTWSLRDEFRGGARRLNPNPDRYEHSAWHFLRTTRSEGPIESRQWRRDGRYQPLSEQNDRVFGLPFDGWIFQASPAESPAVAIASEDKAAGLAVRRGDVIVTPGPQHAVVVGWESPVSGTLEVRGAFEHAQSSTGVAWHVERGPAPSLESGFAPTPLASGRAVFGAATQRGEFVVDGLKVDVGDFLYFTVDAIANGTPTPHYGDGTRLDVTITVRNAVSPPPPSFERDVLPILARKCHDCHGADAREAKLDLRSLSEILRGGENGPALVRGEPHGSLLIDLVEKGQMPPGDHDKVTARELALLRRWTKAGAPADEKITPLPPHAALTDRDREFWAFVPPRKAPEPQVRAAGRVRSPIDRFLLARLEQNDLTFSPDADRQAFIRRASFDLLGLPPSPAAVQAFVDDSRPDAHERLIDELLRSPRYGERWGRHWLDAAGYVDGKLDNDLGTIYPHKSGWRFRDYVIQAFNDDMPFDRFLIEQIAGDELVDWRKAETFDARTLSLLTATGFLRTVDDHTDFPQYGIEKRYEVVNETLDMFSTAVLGLTLECCRCHNHKYDPLPQRDYYRLMACFEPAYNPHSWKSPKDRHLPDVSPAQIAAIDRHNADLDRQIYEVSKRDAETRVAVRKRLHDARLAALPDVVRNELKAALDQEPGKRTDMQKSLVAKHEPDLKITDAQIDAALTEAEKAELRKNADERAALNAKKKSHGMIQALWDVGPPPPSHVHRRGNVKAHGVLVQPGFPEVLQPRFEIGRTNLDAATSITANSAKRDAMGAESGGDSNDAARHPDLVAKGETSGRRLALARWLTRPEHPLTARVFVNRVWHHHFGRGIVETLGNFGRSGSLPTHPELLDWLAVDFIEHEWSVKRLHRQIMLSTAYRQSSRRPSLMTMNDVAAGDDAPSERAPGQPKPGPSGSGEKLDPDNRLLWRMNLRRLEAEAARDAVLAAAGTLDTTAGGPPIEITNPPDGLSEAKPAPSPASVNRRSVYLFARRVYPLKFLEIFDAPIMSVNCTQRMHSATVLQSLAVLNSEFMFAQAEQMAKRVSETAGADATARIKTAYRFALSRAPTDFELTKTVAFLDEQTRGYVMTPAPQPPAGSASKLPEKTDEKAAQLALADLCQMLLSSNEFLYVE